MIWEPERLDDQHHLAEADPGGMLRLVAASAAQVRTGHRCAVEAGVERLTAEGRPRAVVVAGVGGSALAGDILAAVCGPGAPVPVVTVRSYQLPGWVGATDLVIAVSWTGAAGETLALATEAVRRGCSFLAVGPAGSPLEAVAVQSSSVFVPIPVDGKPRPELWLLATPLVVAAATLGLARVDSTVYERVARTLEEIAHRCRPASDSFINPGKSLAMDVAETVPMIWGSSRLAAVAASRFASRLHEDAKYPAIAGELPAAAHDQVAVLDGPLAERDIFADTASRTLRLVVLRDLEEHPQVTGVREAAVRVAQDRDVPVTELAADGAHPLERLASLIGLTDFASTYLALGYGLDPTTIRPVAELKARISH